MPHKYHAAAWSKVPVGDAVPAAVGVPVHVAGVDTAVGIDTFDDGDMAVASCTLHVGLQDDDGWDMRRGGDDPTGGGLRSIVPLVGVANPVYKVAGELVVAQVSPEGALPERETVGSNTRAGVEGSPVIIARLVVAVLAHKGGCCSRLSEQALIRIRVFILIKITFDTRQAEA